MSKHKKTRQQKIIADIRRQQLVYTFKDKDLPTTAKPVGVTPIHQTVIAISTYSFVKHAILKTFLLTLSIVGFQIILFILLKNHIIVLPNISY